VVRPIGRLVVALAVLVALAGRGRADPDPKRRLIVLEYRAGSNGLPGIANRLADELRRQTSLDVLGPDQTRAVFGDHLAQSIVRCAGDADCIAKIGGKVGAAEVLLVGVSELGDVILTMQRIDVADHAVRARVADSLATGATPSEEQLAGYLGKLMPASDFLRFGILDIIASEAGALVTVGGEKRGTTPMGPLRLHAPATYDVRVEKAGFVPFTTKVRLPPDGDMKVTATLQHPGGGGSWFERHTLAIVIVSALVVGGAVGGVVYYETRTTSDHVPFGGMTN
jgi:hypothetical protein